MRYRAICSEGTIVSCLSLTLSPDPTRRRPSDWTAVIFAALESGVNCFEVATFDPVVVGGLAEALAAVDRRLVFVCWRLGQAAGAGGRRRDVSADGLADQVATALAASGLDRLDAVLLDEPGQGEVAAEALATLRALRSAGTVRFLGVRGETDAIDGYMASGAFDILATPFNLTSGWRERNRLRTASARDMAVIGYDAYPRDFHAAATAAAKAAKGQGGWKNPLAGAGSYGFLDSTRGWTGEEICLSYVLTEPSLATIGLEPSSIEHLGKLAEVPEREMPPGLAAQIEMARFAPLPPAEIKRRA